MEGDKAALGWSGPASPHWQMVPGLEQELEGGSSTQKRATLGKEQAVELLQSQKEGGKPIEPLPFVQEVRIS